MGKFIDVTIFYCGNCTKFSACNRSFPSTGKPVKKDGTACMDSFSVVDNPKKLEELK